MTRILCYGDSNTWGFIPGTNRQRYNENERWTRLLQKNLGDEYEVIEEGLNSRTLMTDSYPFGHDGRNKAGRNGFTYLYPCLDTHDKFDIFILMLGTNELKAEFNNSAEDVLNMIAEYAKLITNYKSQIDDTSPRLIIMGVPPIREYDSEYTKDNKFLGATEKSRRLNEYLSEFCKSNNIDYIDNSDLEVGIDGLHLTKESHKNLALKLFKFIKLKKYKM